jgi:hypothetical protein
MVYSYYWDVTKDWKFFQPDTKYRTHYITKLGFLRKQLAYDWPKFYYAIMILNIILRFSWILSISPNSIHIWNPMFVFLVSSLEIFRSNTKILWLGFLWNFIRVEKEHVVNMGEFRAVPEINFPYDARLKKQKADSKSWRDSSKDYINRSEKTSGTIHMYWFSDRWWRSSQISQSIKFDS